MASGEFLPVLVRPSSSAQRCVRAFMCVHLCGSLCTLLMPMDCLRSLGTIDAPADPESAFSTSPAASLDGLPQCKICYHARGRKEGRQGGRQYRCKHRDSAVLRVRCIVCVCVCVWNSDVLRTFSTIQAMDGRGQILQVRSICTSMSIRPSVRPYILHIHIYIQIRTRNVCMYVRTAIASDVPKAARAPWHALARRTRTHIQRTLADSPKKPFPFHPTFPSPSPS